RLASRVRLSPLLGVAAAVGDGGRRGLLRLPLRGRRSRLVAVGAAGARQQQGGGHDTSQSSSTGGRTGSGRAHKHLLDEGGEPDTHRAGQGRFVTTHITSNRRV